MVAPRYSQCALNRIVQYQLQHCTEYETSDVVTPWGRSPTGWFFSSSGTSCRPAQEDVRIVLLSNVSTCIMVVGLYTKAIAASFKKFPSSGPLQLSRASWFVFPLQKCLLFGHIWWQCKLLEACAYFYYPMIPQALWPS